MKTEKNTNSLNILITGGAGFIGTHLSRVLLLNNHKVTSWDIREPLNAVSGVDYQTHDMRKLEEFKSELTKFDLIYHFAAIVSVPLCQADPVGTFATNVSATLRLCDAIQKSGQKIPLVFASSSAVYGDLGEKIASEKELLGPSLSLYSTHKRSCEDLINNYRSFHQLPFLNLRFFNVYGHGQDPKSTYSGVMTLFSLAAKNDQPLQIFGDGTATRDFVRVEDVAEVCLEAGLGLVKKQEQWLSLKAMNVATGRPLTIGQLAELYVNKEKKNLSLIKKIAPRGGDIHYSCADVSLLKKMVGRVLPPVTVGTLT
jgi:UDP-glucose 4-epimerase